MLSKKILIILLAVLCIGGIAAILYEESIISLVPKSTDRQITLPIDEEKGLEVIASEVEYFTDVFGYLAKPVINNNYPGVIMIHEWWGLNEHIKRTARELASEGYVVLAVDMYNGEVATNPDRARELSSSLDQDKAIQNMKSAVAYLKARENTRNVASLGWCFGGGQSLQLALSGEKLDATIIYYGNLITEESKLSSIKWPVQGIFGEEDTVIPIETVKEFKSILEQLGIENEIYIYPAVDHAFANPTGTNYSPNEAEDAWEKTLLFLSKHLKEGN
ncbi:dienelactone hydrolase family protein [[Eubacterium] cellulosolvens]